MKIIDEVQSVLNDWEKNNKVERLWQGDKTLWTGTDENKWLGWLKVADDRLDLPRIVSLAKQIKEEGITDIVLLGMGGSSLCPAMFAKTFGQLKGHARLSILDSTDPLQIKHLQEKINLKQTLFIVSSKSGTTLEPNIFKEYFYAQLQMVLNQQEVGHHFIAITDAHTALETMAETDHFRAVFHGISSIGGRYSALSNFGMVPLGLMGIDVEAFLNHVKPMQEMCLKSDKNNPGLLLGAMLGVCARHGKDKITFIASSGIDSLGAWLEQLLAESTGKNGKGLIPVNQEAIGDTLSYGQDRIFVYIYLENDNDVKQDQAVKKLEQSGFVVIRLPVKDIYHLGAELFRWEMATAILGSIMEINPFNQPDVEESKILTAELTSAYEKNGRLPEVHPFFIEGELSLLTDEKNREAISKRLSKNANMTDCLRAHLNRIEPNDYVDLSAFIEMSAENTRWLQSIRLMIRDHKKVATCLGFGPRFLHSTGQAYKGGPNTGVFLQIIADHTDDIHIPHHHYTFGCVINAQAQGDFTVLVKRSRRVLRIHLGKDVQGGLEHLHALIKQALR